MKNTVKILREKKNMTQAELAETSGLSLRTVQRIEAGQIPKGFTLKAIAAALQTGTEELIAVNHEKSSVERAKLINLVALAGLIIPYGGIIFPLILTLRTKDPLNKELGKHMVGIQIILAGVVSVGLIIIPFLQKILGIKMPLFLLFLTAFLCAKLIVIIKNGIDLNKKGHLCIRLKNNFL